MPGITDAETVGEWEVPFPTTKTTDRDDEYWGAYGGTPKAFVQLKAAQDLWKNRYGRLTSLRAIPREDQDADKTADEFERELLVDILPEDTGLLFQPVKYFGVQAASGTTDFTTLFIGFSFFVIAAAMILIGLLFRLGIERRTQSIGLLEAVGFTRRQIRNAMLTEGLIVASIGSALGLLTAFGYAHLMIYALTDPDWWGGAIGSQFLKVWVGPVSPIAGFLISVIVAVGAILFALRSLKILTPRQLLSGATEPAESAVDIQLRARKHARRARIGFGITLVVTALGLFGVIPSSEAFSGLVRLADQRSAQCRSRRGSCRFQPARLAQRRPTPITQSAVGGTDCLRDLRHRRRRGRPPGSVRRETGSQFRKRRLRPRRHDRRTRSARSEFRRRPR